MPDENVPREKERSCLSYAVIGCLSLIVLAVLGALGSIAVMRYAIRKTIDTYTAEQPASFPAASLEESERKQLQQRVGLFKQAIDSGGPAPRLELSEKDVNALLASGPNASKVRDRVHVAVTGDAIKAEVSLPLDEFNQPALKGRYLNGSGTLTFSFSSGQPEVRMKDFSVNGRRLPALIMDKLKEKNLAEKWEVSPDVEKVLRRIDRIEVKDGKIIIIPKPPEGAR